MTNTEMMNEIARLRAELATANKSKTSLRVSDSGYIEVFGLPGKGRFSISLLPDGWDKLWTMREQITEFCKANKATCDSKTAAYRANKANMANAG